MPPKTAQKVAAADPDTSKAKTKKRKAETPEPASTPAPKKKTKKEPPAFQSLERDTRTTVPIDVTFESGFKQAKRQKDGKFSIVVKLEASNAFSLLKTLTLTDGEFEGKQAIILKPAKAFPFMDLPDDIRRRIYKFYLAPSGVCNNIIVLEARRSNKDVWAKSYSEGSKTRVGLLTANKKICEEATPMLYDHGLRLESTCSLLDFILCGAESMKAKLVNVEIKTWVKTQAKTQGRHALSVLASCVNLARLHIDSGLFTEGDPAKAAKAFWEDGSKFLEAMSAKRGEKGSGVEVLSFGRQALTSKDGKNDAKLWSKDMREEFIELLRARMK